MKKNIDIWSVIMPYLLGKNPVNNAILASFSVFLLHGSYLLWKIYIISNQNLHKFVNLSVIFRETLVTGAIISGFLILIITLDRTRNYPKLSNHLRFLALISISISMAYQGYTFGSMSLPSGIMLIGATLVGFLLFDRRPMYWASCGAGIILILTTVAAIFGWLPYAPKLLDSNFPSERRAAIFLLLNFLIIVIPAYFTVILIADYFINQLKHRTLQLHQLSKQDPLTQLSNRRVIYEYFAEQHKHSDVTWRQHVIIMVDIDFFKKINDAFGHLAGDEVLKYVAAVLQLAAHSSDIVGRFGGEEFIVIMPIDDIERAVTFSEHCQQQFSLYNFDSTVEFNQQLSASFGVACANQGAGIAAQSLESLIEVADQALYHAKQSGRGCTIVL